MREILGAFAFSLFWPAAAAVSLAVGVRGDATDMPGMLLLATGTAGAYALDRLRDGGDGPRVRTFLVCSLSGLATASLILLTSETWRVAVVFILAALAIGYVPLKRIIPKNAIAATAWTIAVVILPAPAAPGFTGEFLLPGLAIACIMFANTTICDFATIDLDRSRGVKSISVCYGVKAACIASCGVALTGIVLAMACDRNSLAATAALHAVIALRPLRLSRIGADAALLLPGLRLLIC